MAIRFLAALLAFLFLGAPLPASAEFVSANYVDLAVSGDSVHKVSRHLIRALEREFSGEIGVNHLQGYRYGDERQVVQMLRDGKVDIAILSEHLEFIAPGFRLSAIPFMLSTWDEAQRVFGDEGMALLAGDLEERSGLVPLGLVPRGFRVITSNRRLDSPDDLEDFRMRVPNNSTYETLAKAMGFKAVIFDIPEIPGALVGHEADGLASTPPTILYNTLYLEQRYAYNTRHIFSVAPLVASRSFLDSLGPEGERKLRRAAATALSLGWQEGRRSNEDALRRLTHYGLMEAALPDAMRLEMINRLGPAFARLAKDLPQSGEFISLCERATGRSASSYRLN
ncbi:MAG: TRAP transporter substrate-binding protein DctP [Succinivibrionaceae bacterium]|nr:TRAP transporter substrate-binding protein DctP [Succinivibrionaceae bacterium]